MPYCNAEAYDAVSWFSKLQKCNNSIARIIMRSDFHSEDIIREKFLEDDWTIERFRQTDQVKPILVPKMARRTFRLKIT